MTNHIYVNTMPVKETINILWYDDDAEVFNKTIFKIEEGKKLLSKPTATLIRSKREYKYSNKEE